MGNTAISQQTEQKEEGWLSLLFTVACAFAFAFALRVFIFQPFTIPSASMEPNLIEGDYIITSKYSVGYGKFAADPLPFPVQNGRLFERGPKRGDIVVFKPEGRSQYYIKRVIGLPGDTVQLNAGELYINDKIQPQTKSAVKAHLDSEYYGAEVRNENFGGTYTHQIFEHIKNHPGDNTKIYTVPKNQYFMMGDNRDHSGDSRLTSSQGGIGFVPTENIIGKAEFILLSSKPEFVLYKPWTWHKLRGARFFKGLS